METEEKFNSEKDYIKLYQEQAFGKKEKEYCKIELLRRLIKIEEKKKEVTTITQNYIGHLKDKIKLIEGAIQSERERVLKLLKKGKNKKGIPLENLQNTIEAIERK